MRLRTLFCFIALAPALRAQLPAAPSFTLEQVKSYPFPNELTAAATGGRIAWALNEQGRRNIWVGDAPDYRPRQLTSYGVDDGQELTSVTLTPDGQRVLYVRGGDHGANWDAGAPNPLSSPTAPKIQLWTIPFAGGSPTLIGEGDDPVVSPKGDVVVFTRD